MKTEIAINVAILGNMNVGKTSLTHRYAHPEREMTVEKIKTHGTDTISSYITICGETVCKVRIWDTAGQEKHANIVGSYVKNLDACLIVFDLTDADSLASVHKWVKQLFQQSSMPVVIVGNKSDLHSEREVSTA